MFKQRLTFAFMLANCVISMTTYNYYAALGWFAATVLALGHMESHDKTR